MHFQIPVMTADIDSTYIKTETTLCLDIGRGARHKHEPQRRCLRIPIRVAAVQPSYNAGFVPSCATPAGWNPTCTLVSYFELPPPDMAYQITHEEIMNRRDRIMTLQPHVNLATSANTATAPETSAAFDASAPGVQQPRRNPNHTVPSYEGNFAPFQGSAHKLDAEEEKENIENASNTANNDTNNNQNPTAGEEGWYRKEEGA